MELQKQEADGSWKTFARHDEYSNFYQHNPAPRWQSKISNGIFNGVERSRAVVTPVNFFGKMGDPIVIDIPAVKPQKTELIWQTDRVDQDCKVIFRNKEVAAKDGVFFLNHSSGSWACPLLYFPKEAWNIPAGSNVRVTMEMETDLEEGTAMVLRLRFGNRTRGTSGVPLGNSGMLRYVFEVTKENGEYLAMLHIKGIGKCRFGNLKIERLVKE